MKLALKLIAVFALSVLVFAQTPAKDHMVVVISLDGLPAYALDDPRLPIPTLRRLMKEGVYARMTSINPTVTWPVHTSMVTGVLAGEHGLLANGTILKTGSWPPVKVDPMLDKEKMVHAPTVYDAVFRAGLTTAQIDWVAINNAPTITYPFSEWASPAGPVEREMIAKGVITAADVESFSKANIAFRDQIWTTAAVYLIHEHKPNLLLLHLLTLDSVSHGSGPAGLPATAATAFLDGCVARVAAAIRDAGMSDRTTLIVVSDHGFKGYTKQVRPAVALAAAGLGDKVYVLPEGGSAYVYLDQSQAAELVPKTIQTLEGVEGIERIIAPGGFSALGLAQPDQDPQMYQLLLVAKDGYAFSGATGGPVTAAPPQRAGAHGYLATDAQMDVIFIAAGRGVRAGVDPGRISVIDIAPTIANLLGVKFPSAKGKPIRVQ
ncbi:MAG: alkaline phosphatase family protein [Bryobacterales bacterium]|nr:alkaline phosphatase family protein [Bryobacterales bacterium]